MSSVPRATEPMRIGLSAVPNVETAHSLTGVGVRSMTVEPDGEHGRGLGGDEAGDEVAEPGTGGGAEHGAERRTTRPRGRRGAAVGWEVVMQRVRSGGPADGVTRPSVRGRGRGRTTRSRTVRTVKPARRPRFLPFIVTGAVLGFVVGARCSALGWFDDPTPPSRRTTRPPRGVGYLGILGAVLFGLLAAVVAVLVDRRADRS